MELVGQTVYCAQIEQNDYDARPEFIGIYSTREKAENAILEDIQIQIDRNFLSLEIYDAMKEDLEDEGILSFDWSIAKIEIE